MGAKEIYCIELGDTLTLVRDGGIGAGPRLRVVGGYADAGSAAGAAVTVVVCVTV